MGANYSKQITYNTVGTVVTLFCQWLIIMLIPKITNFSEAGVFAIAVSVCTILNHVATFSLREFQISDQNLRFNDAEYRTVRIITIALSFVMIIPFIICFDYGWTESVAIVGYLIYRNLLHYAYLYSASLQINDRLDIVGKHSMIEGVLSFVSFVAVYTSTNNLVFSIFAMAIIGGGLFLHLQRKSFKAYVPAMDEIADINKVKKLFFIGIPLFISILAPTFTTALPKLLLQYQWGDEIAGIFSTLSTPTIIIPTLAISVFAPFIVFFTNLSRNGDMASVRKYYTFVVGAILGFGAVCVALSLLFQNWIFETIYGNNMKDYAKYFAYLMFGITAYTVGTVGTTVLITKDQGKFAAPLAFITFIVGLAMCLALIPDHGVAGATFSLIIAYSTFGILISACVYVVPLKTAQVYNNDVY